MTATLRTAARPVAWPAGLAALALMAATAAAGGLLAPHATATTGLARVFWVEPEVRLHPLLPAELAGGGPRSEAVPAAGGLRARVGAGGLEAALGPLDTGAVIGPVSRHIPVVWQTRLDADESPALLQVSCEVTSANGRRGRLSHSQDPSSEIRVQAIAEGPVVSTDAEGRRIAEGGVVLRLDPTPARHAGVYEGTLTISLLRY